MRWWGAVLVGTFVLWIMAASGQRAEARPDAASAPPTRAGGAEPAPAEYPASYVVRAGDGWFRIAQENRIEVSALLAANGATLQTTIHPGQSLAIPPRTTKATSAAARSPARPNARPREVYYVPRYTPPGNFIPYVGNGGGPTLCADGRYSRSSGRGTCSHHGGMAF